MPDVELRWGQESFPPPPKQREGPTPVVSLGYDESDAKLIKLRWGQEDLALVKVPPPDDSNKKQKEWTHQKPRLRPLGTGIPR